MNKPTVILGEQRGKMAMKWPKIVGERKMPNQIFSSVLQKLYQEYEISAKAFYQIKSPKEWV